MHSELAVLLLIACINCVYTETPTTCDEEQLDIYHKGIKTAQKGCFCKEHYCLTKCCPIGSSFNMNKYECTKTTEPFNPPVKDFYFSPQSGNIDELFYINIKFIKCGDKVRFKVSDAPTFKDFHVRTDGKLYIQTPTTIPPVTLVSSEDYCIDNFVVDGDGRETIILDAVVCISGDLDAKHRYLAAGMLISCGFILITAGVYLWLPKLHNVHGRVLVAYLVCLFVGYLFLATMQLLVLNEQIATEACQVMTFIIYFSFLSAFFWLNVMCFDIWRVFSGKREIRPQRLLVWSQLRAYALYAFGIPTLLTILLISLEYSGLPPGPGMPMLRLQGCFLSGYSRLFYLNGPMLILCVANIVLFILTAMKIAKTRKETCVLYSADSSRHDQQNNKQTLFLYVKLFIAMGISWILEVISGLYPHTVWRYAEACNLLIGPAIFLIFVCKRQIFQLITERYRGSIRRDPASQSGTSGRTASTKDDASLREH